MMLVHDGGVVGGDPASSVMMTAPLNKTKEVAGDYKRFHDATDSGPSMNTATVREMPKDIYACT